ncbi:LCP family protein [Microbacteriaceae bacterium VKM Ac-2855]|nr:LCP family protein [Microbacteriaceae bacterium VKM Ac-2855]
MTRRGWWLLASNFVVPGSAQVLAGSRRLGRIGLVGTLVLWAVLAVAALLYFLAPTAIYTIATNDLGLLAFQVLAIAYALLWLVLTLDTLRLIRVVKVRPKMRAVLAVVTVALLAVSVGTASYGSYLAGITRGTLSTIFGSNQPTAAPIDGRYNILLLGGDAGEDREGLRPDSISVVSIDAETGSATTIAMTRELQNIPFPEDSPMYTLYPDGYTATNCNVDVCKLNSIYTEVQVHSQDLYPDAEAEGSLPGVEATRDAVEGILDLKIQYYAMIDMDGFADLIDALGGIDIDYTGTEPLPYGGRLDENGDLVDVVSWLQPGNHHLDGPNALWYARARYGAGGNDEGRMARQHEVQLALLNQFEPANVLSKFQGIASSTTQVLKTDVPQSMLGYFVQLGLKTKNLPVQSIQIAPPDVDVEDPDYAAIQAEVQATLYPDAG